MPIVLTWLWLGVELACSPSPPFDGPPGQRTETFADPGLRSTGATPAVQLWKVRGSYDLPETVLPEGFTPRSTFPLEVELERATSDGHQLWKAPCPIETKLFGPLGGPKGFEVFANGEPLPFAPRLSGRGYTVERGNLVAALPRAEAAPSITVSYDTVRDRLLERDFGTDPSQDPLAFTQTEVTLSRHTRQGLLLPPPGTAEWSVTLPEGARFEGWTGIAPLQLQNLASDGAYVSLSIERGGGEPKVLDRRFVWPARPFDRWQVDLSAYAGQKVTLRLTSEVYGQRDFDYLFVGSPTVWGEARGDVRRVIVIGLDTTRPDHFGFYGYDRPTTPELDEVLASSTVFVNSWTPAPRTRPSFRSSTTGRDPLKAVGATNVGEVFSDLGFATAGIVANIHLQPRFGFHRGFDHWLFDPEAKVDEQGDRALEFLARYPDRDVFLFLHIMDPHLAYRAPASIERKFVEDPDPTMPDRFNRWTVYKWMREGALTEQRKRHIIGMYDAEVRFMDEHLGRLFSQIDRMGEPTVTVMHNDHGEEFFEHGGFEHNHALYDDVTRALLMFRSNAGQKQTVRVEAPATLADIGPTLFDLVGLDEGRRPEVDGRSLEPFLLPGDEPPDWSDRPIGVAHLRYGLEQWGVVLDGHKYIFETASGKEQLYDLTADPGEQKDLARTTGLEAWRQAASKVHDATLTRGWRIDLAIASKAPREPFVVKLPRPAKSALIVDPEAEIRNPANQVWGQPPKRTTADVGELQLSEDKTSITFTPSDRPVVRGQIAVVFGRDVDPSTVVIEQDGEPVTLVDAKGRATWRTRRDSVVVESSTVIDPPPSEIDRIEALEGEAEDMGENRDMLKELGYVE